MLAQKISAENTLFCEGTSCSGSFVAEISSQVIHAN